MPPINPTYVEVLSDSQSSSSAPSDDDEDFDIFGLKNVKNSQTYERRKSSRVSFREKQQQRQEEERKQKKNADSIFDVEIPTIFQTKGARFLDINKRNNTINREIQENEQKLKLQYEKLQQHKSKIIMELNDNGSMGFQKYDLQDDSELIDNLIKQELHGTGIERHFYFLRHIELFDLGDFDKIPHSLLCLIRRDPKAAYGLVKDDLKHFVTRALDTVQNPTHLQAINEMLLRFAEKRVVFTTRELIELVEKCGGDTKLVNETKLPTKIGQFNNGLKMQLARLALIFSCYLLGRSVDWDIFFKLFIMIICDHNCNHRAYESLFYFMQSTMKVIRATFDFQEFCGAVDAQVRSISTHLYGDNRDEDQDMDAAKAMTKGDYQLKVQLINKLDFLESIEKALRDVELDENLTNLYEFSLRVKLLIIEHGSMKETNIKQLRKSRDKVIALKQKVYSSMSKLSSSDYKNETNIAREEMVALITEDYQNLEYLGDILLKKCDFLDGDIFYKEIEDVHT
ncbi:hypothetical protein Cantr_00757 [Candida viswanathii]|uniref:Uncharacterized protein n=1 Tax=Candida viswanathii TaxID=5486 RepID=A0A367YJW3_9ASCO|nr:hypothetical protein Cantr_00757 [Candida viswanathii]